MPAAVATQLFDALAPVRARFPDPRWIGPDKLHLTLVFLGSRAPDMLGPCTDAMAQVAQRHASMDVATGEAGGRTGDRRGGVAWLRIGRGTRELSALALDLDEAVGAYSYGERLQPRPHLTVARRVDEPTIAALRAWADDRPPFEWRVDRVVLFRSYQGPNGSRYESLAETPLAGRGGDSD